ncbi:discoidin domain-containing protein, partial [Campylobacter coli]|nr:discoidin domain-containing protein [Campylobacter coli]
MIFRTKDLINISKGKKAIQSSIHPKWSYLNDAERALDDSIDYLNHAFHTLEEENPWWMIDLEKEELIDIIKIVNIKDVRFRYRAKKLCILVSLDNKNWTIIPQDMIKWDSEMLECVVVLSNKVKARYIKLFLNEKNFFHLSQVSVYRRKVLGYIVCGKPDGFGIRLCAMIIGKYLADKLNFGFLFIWPNLLDIPLLNENRGLQETADGKQYISCSMDSSENIFDSVFLENFMCAPEDTGVSYGNKIRQARTIEELKYGPWEKDWGWFSTSELPYLWNSDINKEECLKETRKIYLDIKFSEKYSAIQKDVKLAASSIKFVAIHLRGGDMIYSDLKYHPSRFIFGRHFPYEIAIEIINIELDKGNNVIIFGQDPDSDEQLANYFYKKSNEKGLFVKTISSFIYKNYSDTERAFFDINFMSYANIIFTSSESTFSRTANLISGKDILKSYFDIFSDEECYDIISKNIEILNLDKRQKAMSCYRLYHFGRILNKDIRNLCHWMKLAIQYDKDNYAWQIYLLVSLLEEKDYNEVEKLAKGILKNNKDTVIFGMKYRNSRYFKDEIDFMIKHSSGQTPYLSFFLSEYLLNIQNFEESEKFLAYALEKLPGKL